MCQIKLIFHLSWRFFINFSLSLLFFLSKSVQSFQMWEPQVNEAADPFNYHPLPHPLQEKTNKQKRDVNTGQLRKFKEKNKNKGKPTTFIRKVNSNTESNFLNYLLKVMYWAKVLKSWNGELANIKMTKNIYNLLFPIFIAIFCFNACNSKSKLLLPWVLHIQPLPQPKKLSVVLDIITTVFRNTG